ncbi:THAP domain-containing protein 3 isoform A [Alligator mississippiensis]|uniref:THAP domain-containing protein 3 isoform A n=1 Tax=Alligator mississippiensis TaxID=8496 RepID=A0A151LYL0_ALLMI|nr:THAP domain-containing protein 3 isoform A [Alligator mississippiensis]
MPKSCAAPRCSNRYSSRCRQLTFHRRGPQQIGNGKSSLKDAEDPPVPKDSTDSWEDRRLDVEAVHQEPQSTTAEHPVEVTTTEAAEMEDRQLKSRPLVQRHHLQSSDHSYAIADCTSLKKKLFQALEENEKLRKCLKVKSVELKRILVRLQTCKKEH